MTALQGSDKLRFDRSCEAISAKRNSEGTAKLGDRVHRQIDSSQGYVSVIPKL